MTKIKSKVQIKLKHVVVDLPVGMVLEYAGWIGQNGGMAFVIYRPEVDWDYNQFVCLVSESSGGEADEFVEVKVNKVTRYRDGGTTDVETAIGNFNFPTPFKKDRLPTFGGEEITVYN